MLTSMKKLKSAIPSLLISLTLIVSFNAFADNLFNCKQGYISCNKALLSGSEAEAVKQSDLSRNLYNCKMGYIGCNQSLLSDAEKQQFQQKQNTQNTTYSGACAENGSCYGDISDVTGLPKTTHVNGYYRRDGTYVRGHYRSRR